MVGPGISPAEGPGFALGSPVAPGGPYDFFSKSPLVTGMGIHQAFKIKPTYKLSPTLDLGTSIGYGTVGGSGNVVNYWGDSIMEPLNPTLGQRTISVPPAFPTHNGGDSVSGTRLSILDGTLAMHDGSGALTGGWFDPHQTTRFVFVSPAWTNTPAQLVPLLPQNIGDGTPGSDLGVKPQILPLHGVDVWGKYQDAVIELLDADLPALPSSPARVTSASVIVTNPAHIVYTAEIANLVQSGPTINAPVLFGTAPALTPSQQGLLPTSNLFGQRMTTFGGGATFALGDNDYDLRAAYSCYSVNGALAATSACTGGTYLYGKIHHGFTLFDLGVELFKVDPQYSPAYLPYGTPQNVWSIAYAPRTWFDNAYQLYDNSRFGSNRQGIRISSNFLVHGVEVRLAGGLYEEVQLGNAANSAGVGFVEPYFTPQITAAGATRGYEKHLDASFAWHPKFADVRLDLTDTTMTRGPSPGNPNELVLMDYPGAVFAISRPISQRIFGAAGIGRFAANGAYDAGGPKNADLSQNVLFIGGEYHSTPTSAYHLQYRLYSVNGIPTAPGGPPPAYHGPQIIFEQLFKT